MRPAAVVVLALLLNATGGAAEKGQEQSSSLQAQLWESRPATADDYKGRIAVSIRRFIIEPRGLTGNPEVQFEIVVFPSGDIASIKKSRASGQLAWDTAVERAILSAQPLPMPKDPTMTKDVKELTLTFRPRSEDPLQGPAAK